MCINDKQKDDTSVCLPPAAHHGPHQQQETLAGICAAEHWPPHRLGDSVGAVTLRREDQLLKYGLIHQTHLNTM